MFVEAIHSCAEPSELHEGHVLIVASVGLFTNIIGVCVFGGFFAKRDDRMRNLMRAFSGRFSAKDYTMRDTSKHRERESLFTGDFNARAVFLKVSTEIMSSVAVILSTIIVKWKHWYVADPITSMLMSSAIIYWALPLLRPQASYCFKRRQLRDDHGSIEPSARHLLSRG